MSIVAGGVQFLIRARVLFAMGALALVLNVHPVEAATCTMTPGVVNATAFQNLLNSCEGQTITFASGIYRFVPNGHEQGFSISAGTTLQGAGDSSLPNPTIFQVAYTGNYQALLWIENVSNVTVEGIAFEGIDDTVQPPRSFTSECPNDPDYGRAFFIKSDEQTSPVQYASVENITIQKNSFRDFNASSWIAIEAAAGSPGIGIQSEIAIAQNSFYTDSDLSSSANPGHSCIGSLQKTGDFTGAYGAWMVSIRGDWDIDPTTKVVTNGFVRNVSIASNDPMNASYMEGAVAIWANVSRVSVQYNNITGAGDQLPAVTSQPPSLSASPPYEPKRYAIVVYDLSHGQDHVQPPDTIWIVGNTITNAESCGVYTAGATNLDINSNNISGQTDPWDQVLPKGAIALNASTTMPSDPVMGNTLSNNYVGLAIAGNGPPPGKVGTNVTVSSNTIDVPGQITPPSGTTGSFGMKLWSANSHDSSATAGFMSVQNVTVTTRATSGATSVAGYDTKFSASNPSSLGNLTQNGWLASGGANPGLSWSASPGSTPFTNFSDVPNFTFNNITANGGPQNAFWH